MIGIDVVRVQRMEGLSQRESFLNGVFTASELLYYKEKGEKAETLAGIYAAKEAAAKAFGVGINGFRLTDIEVTHDGHGAPVLLLHNAAKTFALGKTVSASISHDGGVAVAVVMIL